MTFGKNPETCLINSKSFNLLGKKNPQPDLAKIYDVYR